VTTPTPIKIHENKNKNYELMSHSTIFSLCRLKTDKFSYVSQLQ